MSMIPFTKAWEDAKLLVGDRRSDSDTETLYKSLYNLIYAKAIPQVLEWDMLRSVWVPLTLRADYRTGTVAVTNASAVVTLSSGTFPSTMIAGWKFKIESGADTDDLYEVLTRDSGTQITLTRAFSGTTASGLSYIVYQDLISLPSNFDRFTPNPKIWYRRGGRVQYIDFVEDGRFLRQQIADVGDPRFCRIYPVRDSSDEYRLQFERGFDVETLIYGEYLKELADLTEYTTGSLAVTNGSNTFTGTGTLWLTNVAVGDFIRGDVNGVWYKVTAIGSATSITVANNDSVVGFAGATASGLIYTVCKAPVDIPEVWQSAITYGIAALAAAHQDDSVGFKRWQALAGIPDAVLMNLAKAENRVTYGTQRMRTVYQTPGVRQ